MIVDSGARAKCTASTRFGRVGHVQSLGILYDDWEIGV